MLDSVVVAVTGKEALTGVVLLFEQQAGEDTILSSGHDPRRFGFRLAIHRR